MKKKEERKMRKFEKVVSTTLNQTGLSQKSKEDHQNPYKTKAKPDVSTGSGRSKYFEGVLNGFFDSLFGCCSGGGDCSGGGGDYSGGGGDFSGGGGYVGGDGGGGGGGGC